MSLKSPLTGRWHHGNGVLVCGTIRIAVESFDTLPSQEFKDQMFDWMCETLNAAVAKRVTETPDEFADETLCEECGALHAPGHNTLCNR